MNNFRTKSTVNYGLNSIYFIRSIFILCCYLSFEPNVNIESLSRRYVELHHCSAVLFSFYYNFNLYDYLIFLF